MITEFALPINEFIGGDSVMSKLVDFSICREIGVVDRMAGKSTSKPRNLTFPQVDGFNKFR